MPNQHSNLTNSIKLHLLFTTLDRTFSSSRNIGAYVRLWQAPMMQPILSKRLRTPLPFQHTIIPLA